MLRTAACGSERQPMRSFGRSSVMVASHSTVRPSGARTTQWERVSSITVTRSTWRMKRGRFEKARKKR
jgi:hypothetical protein